MIESTKCVGCQACSFFCPVNAITFHYDIWGTYHASLDSAKCIRCGKCEKICPAININVNATVQTVFAAISKENRSTGSSGGVFYELASAMIGNGGVVYGASFDSNLKLIHKRVDRQEELLSLCRSKYLHSDMSGVFPLLEADLKKGQNVLFVGTPCQAGAVKNAFAKKYSANLIVVDFLCHGTASQKIFDACIRSEEERKHGKIVDFTFRAKTRKAEHSFSYTLEKKGKKRTITGYSFQFPFYYQYLRYSIFNDACYSCPYSKQERVGDITLGDFWKIQEYDPTLDDKEGVSMVSVNTQQGRDFFSRVTDRLEIWSYPIENAAKNNQSFRQPERFPDEKIHFVQVLSDLGEEALVEDMACKKLIKHLVYSGTPKIIKDIYESMKGRLR